MATTGARIEGREEGANMISTTRLLPATTAVKSTVIALPMAVRVAMLTVSRLDSPEAAIDGIGLSALHTRLSPRSRKDKPDSEWMTGNGRHQRHLRSIDFLHHVCHKLPLTNP